MLQSSNLDSAMQIDRNKDAKQQVVRKTFSQIVGSEEFETGEIQVTDAELDLDNQFATIRLTGPWRGGGRLIKIYTDPMSATRGEIAVCLEVDSLRIREVLPAANIIKLQESVPAILQKLIASDVLY